jgi:hypothetical protein
MNNPMNTRTLILTAVLATSGCATVQLSPQRLQANEASMRGAEEVGASGVPTARLHLQLARDQTEAAKKLAADGDDRAPMVLARAQADAELALVLAREVSVRNAALKAQEELKALKARTAE